VEGDDGGFVTFEDDEMEAVGESEFGDAFFEFFQVLGGEESGAEAGCEGEEDDLPGFV
jgi:hypothetical protein